MLGIILGQIAKREIRSSQGAQTGDSIAKAAIIIGWVGLIVLLVAVVAIAWFFSRL